MTAITIDASAWIEVLRGTEIGARVQKYLNLENCITPSIVVSEVCSFSKRTGFDADSAFQMMTCAEVVPLSAELAKTAGVLHADHRKKVDKFSMSDAIVVATAKKMKAKILTKDTDFRGFPEAIILR